LRDFNYDQAVASSSVVVKKMALLLVKYDTYMHWGDRQEDARKPDAEFSHLVTNMTGWDRIVVSPDGEEPPRIDSEMAGVGYERKEEGLKEFSKNCNTLLQDIDLSSTYTFCFWGVSQLLDVLHWKFRLGFGATFDMSTFFEEWPIHCCMYEIDRPTKEEADHRHLEVWKRYYLDFMIFSNTTTAVEKNEQFLKTYTFMDAPASLKELPDSPAPGQSRAGAKARRLSQGIMGRLKGSPPNGKATASRSKDSEADAFFDACSDDESDSARERAPRGWFCACRSRNGNHSRELAPANQALLESRKARILKAAKSVPKPKKRV